MPPDLCQVGEEVRGWNWKGRGGREDRSGNGKGESG